MLIIIILLAVRFSNIDTCPSFCQCYSAFDGYHVTCQNAKLYEIPSSLLKFLQTTEHQNIIVDLSSNFLSFLPCDFFEISIIITLVLSKNQIQTIPSCFSQSSIQILRLNENQIQFNQTMLFSSTKLHYLDLSNNRISYLPRTFLNHLRRLRTLILNSQMNLFQENSDQWIRSLTTRNQLTIIICDENFTLPLCLFDSLFQSKKLLSIEINPKIHCDCSFVYLPLEKIHFRHCQNEHQQEKEKCNSYASHFDHGDSLIHMKAHKYRQICAKEYQICQNLQLNTNIQLTTNEPDRSLSKNQLESMLPIINSSINKSLTTSILTVTSLKKENITAGSIIPFILLLLIVTTVCLYIILSGRFVKMKNRGNFISLIMRKKQQRHTPKMTTSVNSDENSVKFNECISIENINMNSNIPKASTQRRSSYSDEESDVTFYSITRNSSDSVIQSSMTEIHLASSTSTINSSLSSETVIISNRNQQRIY